MVDHMLMLLLQDYVIQEQQVLHISVEAIGFGHVVEVMEDPTLLVVLPSQHQ